MRIGVRYWTHTAITCATRHSPAHSEVMVLMERQKTRKQSRMDFCAGSFDIMLSPMLRMPP